MKKVRFSLVSKIGMSVIVLCSLFAMIFLGLVINTYTDSYRELLQKETSEKVDIAFNQMSYIENRAKILCINCAELRDLLSSDAEAIEKALGNYVVINSDLIRVAYYVDSEGNVFCSNPLDLSVLKQTLNYHVPEEKALEHNYSNAVTFSEPYRSSMFTDTTVAVCCNVYSGSERTLTGSGKAVGTVILELNLESICNSIKNTAQLGNTPFLLMTCKKNLIISNPKNDLSYKWENDLLSSVMNTGSGWTLLHTQKNSYCVDRRESANNGWTIAVILDESQLYAAVSLLSGKGILISILLFTVLTGIVILLTAVFLKPLKQLAEEMKNAQGNGKVPVHKPFQQNDEMGDLSRSYAGLLKQLQTAADERELLERQRHDAELRVFQSQVNPHFLYNTLNCIGSLIQKGETAQIPLAISSLIHLMALSMDKTEKLIPLSNEIDCLEGYVRILKLRYGDRFDFINLIDSETKDYLVPKLVLQPLVENSIFHGILPGTQKGTIMVKSETVDGILFLSVIDDGVGIPEEKTRQLLTEPLVKESDEARFRFRSIGLYNTLNRIRLEFGETYGIQIHSTQNVGTCIEVTLPCITSAEPIEKE